MVQVDDPIVVGESPAEVVKTLAGRKVVGDSVGLRMFRQIPLSKKARRIAAVLEPFGNRVFVFMQDGIDLFRKPHSPTRIG